MLRRCRSLLKLVKFPLSDIGEGIAEVEVLQWYVKEGDNVEEFTQLCEVRSDKATTDISSRYAGKIMKLHADVGGLAYVHQPLVDIEVDDNTKVIDTRPTSQREEEKKQAPPAAPAPEPAPAPAPTPAPGPARDASGKILTSPAVKLLARENGVDLAQVTGTGPKGRIIKTDILNFLASPPAAAPSAPLQRSAEDKRIPITGIRKAMVTSMTASIAIPAFGCSDEVSMNNLIATRKRLKPLLPEIWEQGEPPPLSFLPFIIKAVSLGLERYPEINAHVEPDCSSLIVKADHNISVAIDSPSGLVVPNIKQCQHKSIPQIAYDLSQLTARAKAGKLTPDDIKDGTFSVSNIGAIGGTYMRPIVFAPQVAIGALGAMRKEPRFDENDNVIAANLMHVSWSADHRVVDGATMVRFSNAVKGYIESPDSMLLSLS